MARKKTITVPTIRPVRVKRVTLVNPKPIKISVKTRIPGLRSMLRGKRG